MIPAHSAHFHKYKNIFLPIILLFSFDLIVLTALLNRIANPASLSRFFPKAQSDGFSIKATVPSNIDLTGYSLYICRWKSEELKNAGDVPNGYECPQGQLVVSEQTEYSFENVVPGANNEVYVILKPNNSNDPKDNPIKATGNDCSTSESHPGHCLITLNDNNLNYQVNFIKITDQGTNLDESIIDISKGDLSKSQKDSTTENTSPDITPTPTVDPFCTSENEDTPGWVEKCTEKMADKGVIDREKWGFGEEYIAPEIMPSTQLDLDAPTPTPRPKCDLTGLSSTVNCEMPLPGEKIKQVTCDDLQKDWDEYNKVNAYDDFGFLEKNQNYLSRWECYKQLATLTNLTAIQITAVLIDEGGEGKMKNDMIAQAIAAAPFSMPAVAGMFSEFDKATAMAMIGSIFGSSRMKSPQVNVAEATTFKATLDTYVEKVKYLESTGDNDGAYQTATEAFQYLNQKAYEQKIIVQKVPIVDPSRPNITAIYSPAKWQLLSWSRPKIYISPNLNGQLLPLSQQVWTFNDILYKAQTYFTSQGRPQENNPYKQVGIKLPNLPKSSGISYGALSDIGRNPDRPNNEDSFAFAKNPQGENVFVVADGMGGYEKGEVASRIATERVSQMVQQGLDIDEGIYAADRDIRNYNTSNNSKSGTTIVVAKIGPDGKGTISNAGDSGARIFRNGQFYQAFIDDSPYPNDPQRRNIINNALGGGESIQIHHTTVNLASGDVLILYSDGLEYVSDGEITNVLGNRKSSPQQKAQSLINLANSHGGPDNTTVVVVEYK